MIAISVHQGNYLSALFITLIICIMVGSTCVAASGGPFAELPADHWCYQAMDRLFSLGLIGNDSTGYSLNNHNITRYELAVWVKNAIESLDYKVHKNTKSTSVNQTSLTSALGTHHWDLDELFKASQFNESAINLNNDDIKLLIDLVNLVRPELEMLGQKFSLPGSGLFAASLESKSQTMSMSEKGVATDDNLATFTLPTSLGNRSILYAAATTDMVLLPTSESTQDGAGFGLAVNVGDVQLTAGRSHYLWAGTNMETITSLGLSYPFGQDASVSANLATMFSEDINAAGGLQAATALGLGLRLPKIKVKLNYALQSMSDKTDASVNNAPKLTASAGLGYQLAPSSEASAGFSITGNLGQQTTANFGLRYTLNAASLSLGYQLSSSEQSGELATEKSTGNIASAEFTIRF